MGSLEHNFHSRPFPQMHGSCTVARVLVVALLAQQLIDAQSTCQLRLSTPPNAKSLDLLWQVDNLFWVSQSKNANSQFDVYVVGDTLRLTPALFSMLTRTDDRPITNWNRIVFDARKITVAMPLVFDSATVELRAETIVWEPEGLITLKPYHGVSPSDGLKLTARTIDFSNAPPIPFDFDTDNWKSYPDNGADVAANMRWPRTLSLSARRLVPPKSYTSAAPDSWNWVRDLTRDRWDVLRGGSDATFSRRPYIIETGTQGESKYQSSLTSEMLWPSFFASKVERVFAQNPYDASGASF